MSARTKRNKRGTFAGEGGVKQEGKLPIYDCLACGHEVVWATSSKTGRKYLVNVSIGAAGSTFYMKNNVHRCEGIKEQADDWTRRLEEAEDDRQLGILESVWESAEGRDWHRVLGCLNYIVNVDAGYGRAARAFERRYGR